MRGDILPQATADLFSKLGPENLPDQAYLGGGTACALWLGHRQSVDLDFFSPSEFEVEQWRQKWEKEFDFKMFNQDWQTLEGEAHGVKLAIFYYKYPLIETPESYKSIRVAKLEDLVAMKLEALVNRGTKRDFVDLYFLIKKFGFKGVLNYYDRKYGNLEERELLLRKSLIYFDDAEEDEMPKMLVSITWEEIKQYFEKVIV